MLMNRFTATTVMLGFLAAGFAPSMRADDFNRETHFSINQPLQVQNAILAPGKYVLKLTEAGFDHMVVSIYNADGTRLDGIVMGFSAYRGDAGDEKLIVVSQAQGDQPSRLRYWFYPGDNYGIEFAAKSVTSEATYWVNSNGRVVKSKDKGQAADAAGDASSGHN
jgi:hypothetical protein